MRWAARAGHRTGPSGGPRRLEKETGEIQAMVCYRGLKAALEHIGRLGSTMLLVDKEHLIRMPPRVTLAWASSGGALSRHHATSFRSATLLAISSTFKYVLQCPQ